MAALCPKCKHDSMVIQPEGRIISGGSCGGWTKYHQYREVCHNTKCLHRGPIYKVEVKYSDGMDLAKIILGISLFAGLAFCIYKLFTLN